ncbi:MAG: sulfotransferase family protein [Thiohalorhabdus sp.]
MGSETAVQSGFEVDPWLHVLGRWASGHPRFWSRLGNLETRLLRESLADVEVERPVYIAGLARSGSTLLLELLSAFPGVATHRYRDFPFLHIPFLWNRFLDRAPRRDFRPRERSHRDGITITPESPEAFEEMLWMAFFPGLHDPASSDILDGSTSRPEFEAFYRDHIRKLLLARSGDRYVSKANYNVTRLEYLLRVFGDARFLIPVRDPVWHVASLMKQQRLFRAGQREHPRAVGHLRQVGHFEFGLDRRPINAGNGEAVAEIEALWKEGREVEGWARYWAEIHTYLADRLAGSPALREASLVVRYEELCAAPEAVLSRILDHCGLPAPDALLTNVADRVRFPTYYQPGFSAGELEVIHTLTSAPAARLGLEKPPQSAVPLPGNTG